MRRSCLALNIQRQQHVVQERSRRASDGDGRKDGQGQAEDERAAAEAVEARAEALGAVDGTFYTFIRKEGDKKREHQIHC